MVGESKILEKIDPLIGECIGGRFIVERRIDEGGFGAVYLAADLQLLGRKVVIKVLLDTLIEDTEARRKFDHEKEALARLDHPVIVNILAAGALPDDKPYLVMPYIEGRTLKSIITERGALPLSFCAKVIESLTDALSAAHSKGILHRDVKPPNIILTEHPDGTIRTRLIDFGIARVYDSKVSPVTQIEKVQGTLCYMSPEQLQGKLEQTPAVDIFSCAVVFYEMLTGKLPFEPQSIYEMYQLHQEGVKQRIIELRPEVPVTVDQLILQGLSFVPEERPTDICEFGKSITSSLLACAGKTDHKLGENLLLTVKLQNLDLPLYEKENKFNEKVSFNESPNNVISDITQPSDLMNARAKTIEPIKQAEVTHILPKTIGSDVFNNETSSDYVQKDFKESEQRQGRGNFLTARVLVWTGLAVWMVILIIVGYIAIDFFPDPSDGRTVIIPPKPEPSKITEPEITTTAPPKTDPNLLSYYLSVKKTGNGKRQEPVRTTGKGMFFENKDEVQIILESAFSGYLYLFNERKELNGLEQYILAYPKTGLSVIQANKSVSSHTFKSDGIAGTDKFWLIWTAERKTELENAREAAIKNPARTISNENAVKDLRKFLQEFSNQKAEGVIDNANQQIIIMKSGDIVIHLIELEER